MKPILRAACLSGMLWGTLGAQSQATTESLSAWPYYKEIRIRGGPADFVLDTQVLDKARTDHADLRLYDASAREIPYALRIRRELDTRSLFTSREFNRAAEGTAALISCDLGEQPQEHNEAVISTVGNNFRRLAEVQGSPDGAQWVTLVSQAILFRFTAAGRTVEQDSVSYPVSRYRYLRVRVERDPQVDRAAPEITSLAVRRAIRSKGQTVSFAGALESREADPFQGRPSSIWRIDLGGRIPLQSLALQVAERAFSRPFQLESVDDPTSAEVIASGNLVRLQDDPVGEVRIDFGERFARRLKLTVIDDRNPPLSLLNARALSASRQVIFQAPAGVIRVYYGNPKGMAPHYDLPAGISANEGVWDHPTLAAERANPIYRPEPKPLSERSPWLVYLVLIGACASLAAILLNLARIAARTSARIAAQ
jgi:hypothetical protein